MLFKIENARKISRPGFTAYVYNSKEQYPILNTVYVDCFKDHEKVFVKNSHRLYFVIEGKGTFTIKNEKLIIKKNDVVVVEPTTEYSYEGKMKLFEVNFPATSSEDEVKLS